ncbi:hypothetical protein DSO57_1031270 [Entomophthora muscae]|uniref:Uncharacterized protein n=1 Tax=Entomophthora muscae TaxID=34485 RepID=A0ACC2UKJ3_9FUNG|nr:hypothetical protein DSO57_1031270 [Entomophthora muscae]
MTPPITPRPDRPLEPTAAAKTTSTQLFGLLYINLTGLVDSMVPNSGPWSLLGKSISYIINLAAPHPEPLNASTYDWIPDKLLQKEITPDARSRILLDSAVSFTMQGLYTTVQLSLSSICPSFTDCYLHQFVHPATYHILQLVATPHSEVLQHLGLFSQLHYFILQLQQETSTFGNENQNTLLIYVKP